MSAGVECVLLNACHSEVQAQALSAHVNCVIGMNRAIGDTTARKFSEGFYDGLGYGKGYAEAFEWGKVAITADGLPGAETIRLFANPTQTTPIAEPESALVGAAAHAATAEASAVPAFRNTPSHSYASTSPIHEPISATRHRTKAKVFISYKRNGDPDELVALELYKALGQNHEVFIDQAMSVGTRWAEQIDHEIRRADAVIFLLSASSVESEMVQEEIRRAIEVSQTAGSQLQVLPVRVAYREPFQYPLSRYLDPINWAFLDRVEDVPRLVREIEAALAGKPLPLDTDAAKASLMQRRTDVMEMPQPSPMAQLELPEGTMDPVSDFYVMRESDAIAASTLQRQGITLTIKGPRQMGKSSLLVRTVAAARDAGKQVAFLDFQLFDQSALDDANTFYREFCTWLSDELDLDDEVEKYWSRPVSNNQRCTRYVSRHVLKQLKEPLVLAMDEVERIFDAPFRNDFFSMLRSWHNQRATSPMWKRLDLALVTSTEPYQLIADLNQSPFNVGQIVRLEDFSEAQVKALNQKHGSPLSAVEEYQLMELLSGHPYLTRKALYELACGRLTITDLIAGATEERGPFGDHLRYHLFRMCNNPELVQGLLEVLEGQHCSSEQVFFRLNGAGLVYRRGRQVVPRCRLYETYFAAHLGG